MHKVRIDPSNAEATFIQSTKMQRFFENHLSSVVLVFIGKLLLRALRCVPICPDARVSVIFSCFPHQLFLMITIFMGSGWPMFYKNTLMLYRQD